MFEILTFTFLPNHVPGTMPNLSIFIYLDSTHFSEFFGISHMIIAILFSQWLAYSFIWWTFPRSWWWINQWINQSKIWLSPGLIKNESLINQRTHNCRRKTSGNIPWLPSWGCGRCIKCVYEVHLCHLVCRFWVQISLCHCLRHCHMLVRESSFRLSLNMNIWVQGVLTFFAIPKSFKHFAFLQLNRFLWVVN